MTTIKFSLNRIFQFTSFLVVKKISNIFLPNLKTCISLIIVVTRVREFNASCQSGKSRNAFFSAASHLTLSRYYYFIFYSSFYLLFCPLSLLPRLRQAASGGSYCSTNHFHPLSSPRPSVFSHPLLPTHPYIPSISHSSVIRFSLTATPRHATFDFHAREDDDDDATAAAERRAKCRSKSPPYYFAPAGSVFVHSTIVEVYCRP